MRTDESASTCDQNLHDSTAAGQPAGSIPTVNRTTCGGCVLGKRQHQMPALDFMHKTIAMQVLNQIPGADPCASIYGRVLQSALAPAPHWAKTRRGNFVLSCILKADSCASYDPTNACLELTCKHQHSIQTSHKWIVFR